MLFDDQEVWGQAWFPRYLSVQSLNNTVHLFQKAGSEPWTSYTPALPTTSSGPDMDTEHRLACHSAHTTAWDLSFHGIFPGMCARNSIPRHVASSNSPIQQGSPGPQLTHLPIHRSAYLLFNPFQLATHSLPHPSSHLCSSYFFHPFSIHSSILVETRTVPFWI